ncbi:tRNA pseudouridine synthase-like 1 [Mugil cephalus]|uniref:tRNA pseudouridine synthase-like 1 n=1 Tax=Mugil cephalus TaxID=48193 RepID=UPI001FB73B22|nr:tRNA pseudouridine synthase-like 1 [Mugil cephalus]XP_047438707.1 tRNA pseudouridine synthase-like 1 [Mugil cephalus]XP_047438708.1 tRNA pseudouridine synthase-like 1 [Mugil cephalus]XP_047438709.1 tRNA pseudouridine synthase-like 1 [Mugil cephalus]XP_047438710.1 tRNA pseudouridine synthase-like 1 [Mugil cephalus]XP_047438712.1 tRNA pseudouridine synthase-like 1 [Mugil cephalus]XP_047438713.1 tRNA pseudouridine synthase-like 1 [Mugil cephalus]
MHNCARYLIFFQYIGTKYKGVIKIPPHEVGKTGVQNHLEDAIQRLKPVNPVRLWISSRTDTGVHALCNTAHFDLQRKDDKVPFTEDILVKALNDHLMTEHVRITHARRVPNDFSARFRAQSRTYVYRLALGFGRSSMLPLPDSYLCWSLPNTELDVKSMHEAADLLVGTHDFSTFRAVSSDMPFKDPVKTMDVVSVKPGNSFASAHFHRDVPMLELTFTSRSFLYKQVRRMTGAIVAVGQGRLSVPQFKEVLEARDSLAYPQGLTAPPFGLFLTRVDYNETDLQFSPQLSEEQLSSTRNSEG